jgi:succinyl-CoA synthetase beta subunit
MRRGRAGGIRMVENVDSLPLEKKWAETYLHKALFLDLYDYSSIYEVVLCLFNKIFMYSYILPGKTLF